MESNNFLGGVLAGALLGVALGILLATTVTGETKQKLVKGAKKVAGSVGNAVSDTLGGLKEQYDEGVEQANR